MLEKRSIPVCIILSIVTCGIYSIYWYYMLARDMYESNTPSRVQTTPGMVILFNILTCGIYGLYVYYKWGQQTPEVMYMYNLRGEDRSIIYLLLGIFSFGIINMALIQSDLNSCVDMAANGYAPGGYPGPGGPGGPYGAPYPPGGYAAPQQPPTEGYVPPTQQPYPQQPGQPFPQGGVVPPPPPAGSPYAPPAGPAGSGETTVATPPAPPAPPMPEEPSPFTVSAQPPAPEPFAQPNVPPVPEAPEPMVPDEGIDGTEPPKA